MKNVCAAILLGMGLLVGGCGNNQPAQQLVQLDNGKYIMNNDEYGINYVKGYSDNQITNYMMIRVIGEDNNKTVDELVKCYKNKGILGFKDIQVLGYAVEYKGNIYRAVGGTHMHEGQKVVVPAKFKNETDCTIEGAFKEFALAEVTKVDRDETGHLMHTTYKVVKDMKSVKVDDIEHFEVNE